MKFSVPTCSILSSYSASDDNVKARILTHFVLSSYSDLGFEDFLHQRSVIVRSCDLPSLPSFQASGSIRKKLNLPLIA